MNSKSPPPSPAGSRLSVIVVAAACLILGVGALGWRLASRPSSLSEALPSAVAAAEEEPQPKGLSRLRSPGAETPAAAVPQPETTPAPTVAAVAPLLPNPAATEPVDPIMGNLVTGLARLGGTNALTLEAIQAWRTNFQQLVLSGPAAVPALRAFLAQNQESLFDAETMRTLGVRSARLGAFEALRQIGGPESIDLLDQTLGETKTPREVAALAGILDSMAEGQYREKGLAAARSALAQIPAGQPQTVDVAPLFEVFQQFGDAALVPELEQAAGRWKYYATSALANLPDSAGVPALLRMAEPAGNSGNRLAALEELTRLATQNDEARQFLLRQVGTGQIPANLWPYLNAPLAGEEQYPVEGVLTKYPPVQSWSDVKSTRIVSGNQCFYTLPGPTLQTADGINQRLALLDQLGAIAGEPAARQTLQQAREKLIQRLNRLATAPPQK